MTKELALGAILTNAGTTLLLLLFLCLKLTGQISWSWWWVMAPMWIPGLLAISALVIYVLRKK